MQGSSQVVLVVKNPPDNAGDIRDVGLIPGLGRSPGAGHDNPLQYSCLENPMDKGSWWSRVHEVTKVRYNWSDLTCKQWIQRQCTHLKGIKCIVLSILRNNILSGQNVLFLVQLLSCIWLFVILWTAACQASLSFTISWSFAQTHVHWVDDANQTSHPLFLLSPATLNLSQHQGIFQCLGE